MLVLTRKKDETLQIGDAITITVLKVKGNSVQLGIEAPQDVRVLRSELLDRDRNNSESVSDASTASRCSGGALRELAAKAAREHTAGSASLLQTV